jgi:predicted nucleic acid-binding protein
MSVLIDTNVVLDLLLARPEFVEDADQVISAIEFGDVAGYMGATSLTTVDYFAARAFGRDRARELVKHVLTIFEIATVNRAVLEAAALAPTKDFEDAVLVAAARLHDIPTIITRNAKDFLGCGLQIYTPREWLASKGL